MRRTGNPRLHTALTLALLAVGAGFSPASLAGESTGWLDTIGNELGKTYREGTPELYVPVYTWHLPFAYSREKINGYQNFPMGLGYGHGRYDDKGNWHGVYAMGFQDSHFKPEWVVGYGWKTYWNMAGDTRFGLGFAAGLTSRSDYAHYAPVPYILPVAAVENGRFALEASYVPGGAGFGNVVFFNTKWRFDGKPSSNGSRP